MAVICAAGSWQFRSSATSRDEHGRRETHFLATCASATQDNEANAEFIVRARNTHADLLAACKAALRFYGDFESVHDGGVIAQLRAAIAKAEGEKDG